MTYSPSQDGHQGYLDARRHQRNQALFDGEELSIGPLNAEERRIVMEGRVIRAFDTLREAVNG